MTHKELQPVTWLALRPECGESKDASERDHARLAAMGDEDIDFSDLPEIPPERFAEALVRKGLQPVKRKTQLTLRVDTDVLEWLKAGGKGYQTRINSILKAYKEAHQSGR